MVQFVCFLPELGGASDEEVSLQLETVSTGDMFKNRRTWGRTIFDRGRGARAENLVAPAPRCQIQLGSTGGGQLTTNWRLQIPK
jgi:hypothetical protein